MEKKERPNVHFKAYLNKKQFKKFAEFLAWLKKDKQQLTKG